jgi:ribose transport system substrate-binding protein
MRKTGFIKAVMIGLASLLVGVMPMSAQAKKKPVVGLVMKSLANEFFKQMEEGAVAFAKKDGTFDLIPVGMNSESDIDTQINAVDNFIAKKVDVIVVAPADSVGMVSAVKRAVDAGIVVVNFDVTLNKDAMKKAGLPGDFLFVGVDNAEGAELVGDHLGKTLGQGGKVFIIEGNPGADNASQRKEGFMRSVKKFGLNVLSSTTAHWDTEEANTVVTNLLTKYPDVKGIMCANDSMVLGAVRALDAAGRKDVLVIGFDNILPVQDLIKRGKCLATIDQFGPDLASNGIKAGLRMLKGEKLTGWQKTPLKLVTKADFK